MSKLNPKELLIEEVGKHDYEEIIKINREEYWKKDDRLTLDALFELGRWWVIPELFKWHKKIIDKCNGEIIIAKYRGEIIAELDYVISPDCEKAKFERIHIIWLIVKKKYRNNGIAKLLLTKLKIRFQNLEIWVEAEDERSLSLYSSIGKKRKNINNWVLKLDNFIKDEPDAHDIKQLEMISYDELVSYVKNMEIFPIIGRYYAPNFDVEQLRSSDEVYQYIWGNTVKSTIYIYQYKSMKIFGILTQYLRIYVDDSKFTRIEFQHLLSRIIKDIFKLGFDMIYAQTYSEDMVDIPLRSVGFSLEDESDYVFMI